MLMKKLLLMLVAVMATMTAFANAEDEGWTKSFTPVADKSDLAGVHTAVAADGSVYVSSTYDQAFTFAEKSITDPDGLLSSCIVKYDAEGNEKWAVSLVGKCTINAMTVDADGTLYVAGKSEDVEVICTGTDGGTKTIVNPTSDPWGDGPQIDAYSAFVAKISTDGVFEAVKVLSPEINAEIAVSEFPFYLPDKESPIDITPTKIAIDANKILVAASYLGDLKDGDNLIWEGGYFLEAEFGMYFDTRSRGVLMLNKSDLSGTANVTYVKATGIPEKQFYPEALDFVVYDGVPHVAFFGFGNLTMTTPAGSKDFEFNVGEEGSGNREHALVLANVTAPSQPMVFNAAMNDKLYPTYNLVDATLAGTNCILAGTFYGNFPLDNSVTKEANTSFVASIKMSDCSVNWAKANEVESEAKCMVVTGEEIKASTDAATYTFKTETGDLDAGQTMEKSFEDADCYNDQYVSTVFIQETSVVVFSPKLKPSGINEAQAQKNGALKYYNVNGVELSAPQKGLNIIKTTEGTRKVVK